MQKAELYLSIEKILDEWDPIGILQSFKPLIYTEGAIGEYTSYIKPVIETYLSNQSINDFLIKLNTYLRDYPNEEQRHEINCVSDELHKLLSKTSIEFLRECMK